MHNLNVSELTWPQQVALDDYVIYTQRLPCQAVAAEQWLERKRNDLIEHIMHINEQASYTAFLARLIKDTPSPAELNWHHANEASAAGPGPDQRKTPAD